MRRTSMPDADGAPWSSPPASTRRRIVRWLARALGASLALAAALAVIVPACSTGNRATEGARPGPGGTATESCSGGDRRACHVVVDESAGVLTCFHGVQTCAGGVWGVCEGGDAPSFSSKPWSAESTQETKSLSDAGSCNSPCDPSCNQFDEVPDGGVGSDASQQFFDWQGGQLASFPSGLVNKGLKEPCSTSNDCQYDHYCSAPSSGSCSHHKCAVGPKLVSGCDRCVTDVCSIKPECCTGGTSPCSHDKCLTGAALEKNCEGATGCVAQICNDTPSCCTTQYTGNCAHNPCAVGAKLAKNCEDPSPQYVRAVCNEDGYCCNKQWDAACVAKYAQISGQSCAQGAWNQTCVDKVLSICGVDCSSPMWTEPCVAEVYKTCGAFCDARPPCAHNVCTAGAKLDPDCDPCAKKVCDIDPYCCSAQWDSYCVGRVAGTCALACPPACAHDKCQTGEKLAGSCDSCVQQVCAVDPSCCSTSWTQGCVDKVHSVCGHDCAPTCAHDKCYFGPKLDAACDPCVAQICADPAFASCCSGEWTSACVAQVKTKCGINCPTAGDCVPYKPGETDPGCAQADLTVGVPCDGKIPVCNRGSLTAPANVRIVHFPANSQQYPLCTPDQTHPAMETCYTPAAIPPGHCISVTGCPKLIGNREIMVNPPGADQVNECTCKNNWSLYNSNGCTPPCSGSSCSSYAPVTYTQHYSATCPDESTVQWGFLAYDTTTPSDTSVTMEARTAQSVGALSGPYAQLATAATAGPDPPDCQLTGPLPDCPISLYDKLSQQIDLGAPHQDVLELRFTLNPSSHKTEAPTVHSWQVTYTCTASK